MTLRYKTEPCTGDYPTPMFVVSIDGVDPNLFSPVCSTADKAIAEKIEHALNLPSRIEHKHIQWFVWGALSEYDYRTNLNLSPEQFQHYLGDTVDVVVGYLNGTRTLDGGCSDIQCIIATEAAKVFKEST